MAVVKIEKNGVMIHGKFELLLCASLFYFRVPKQSWEERIALVKALGYNTLDVYFPWNFHEIQPDHFDFNGERDVREFLRLCKEHGMYVIARPGPYICSEWDGGGLPSWICSRYDVRQNNADYLAKAFAWYDNILPILREYEKAEEGKGGIILVQLENELDFFDCRDVEGMIGALRDKARACGIQVPLFCCAGQGDIERAGGCVSGVFPTYNFYPNLTDAVFDGTCRAYAQELAWSKQAPLLVSETGREHALLKRELSAGAKLMGAYNQVAGSNFGYTQSINNWGDPESIITTQYDFESMISTLGDCRKEADEALLFSASLRAYGERLAQAQPIASPVSVTADFALPKEINALCGQEGELYLFVANVTDRAGRACVHIERPLEVCVGEYGCVMLPYHVRLGDVEIVYSNYELLEAGADRLILYGEGDPMLCICRNGEEHVLTKDGSCLGLTIQFLTRAQAAEREKQKRGLQLTYVQERGRACNFACHRGTFRNLEKMHGSASLILSENEIWRGGMEIELPPASQGVFLENVSDFFTVLRGAPARGGLYGGENVILPPSEQGYHLRVEKWGHCNFDDPRTNSLRIASMRGIGHAYEIAARKKLPVWHFTLADSWAPPKLTFKRSALHARLGINAWNSTRVPLLALYYTQIERGQSERVKLRITGGQAEIALYAEGEYMGTFSPCEKTLDLTDYFSSEQLNIQLLVRKRNWGEQAGEPELFYLNEYKHAMVRPFGEQEMVSAQAEDARADAFPITMKAGETQIVQVDLQKYASRACYGVVRGEGYKLTAVSGGKVVARMVGKVAGVQHAGGSAEEFLIPAGGDGKLKMIVEALQDVTLDFAVEYQDKENKITGGNKV